MEEITFLLHHILCTHVHSFSLSLSLSLSPSQHFYKKAAAFVLCAVAKHSPELAPSVVDSGALDALVICLEEFDPGVKESTAWVLGYNIARHYIWRQVWNE